MERWFDLNGARLKVVAEGADLVRPLLLYLEELSAGPAAAADFTLTLARSTHPEPPPSNAEVLSEGMLPERRVGRLAALNGHQWLSLAGELGLMIDTSARRARIEVLPGREPLVGGTAALHALAVALSACGQHLIHGAALRRPHTDRGFLLLAPSGVGKTTTALSLALSGFGLLTDDAAVLDTAGLARGQPARIWGLPRPLKVHRNTAELLPAIKPLMSDAWDSNGEQGLMRGDLGRALAVPPARPIDLSAIVLLGPRVSGDHLIRPARRSEVLVKTATDNVFRAPRSVLADDVRRFGAIAAAVAATSGYELNVGSRLDTLGAALDRALG
jgi:hypothetical protein